MTTTLLRGIIASALLALPAVVITPAQAAPAAPEPHRLSLAEAIDALPRAAESRAGYERTKFKHWVDADRDRCNTRAEVLLEESRTKPAVEGTCKVLSGTWFSYYDGKTLTDPKGLDIDHMVPLAESWDSGASQWSAARRRAYANDLDAERSLIAVTAKSNRSKADQDPSQWLPPLADAYCTYTADWLASKLRWGLTADKAEVAALDKLSEGCGRQEVQYVPAAEDANGA